MATDIDFSGHNEEVRRVWETYRAGYPIRVPMILGLSSRFYLLNEKLNTGGITYKSYFESPQVMLDVQCRFQDYIRHHVYHDIEMGLPKDGWTVSIDFQNVYDASWFGCEILFLEGQCPDTKRLYSDENKKWELLREEYPGPFDGLMGRVREFYEYWTEQKRKFLYKNKPVREIHCSFPTFTDGPFTLGCQLWGPEQFCMDMLCDPEYFHQAMAYMTSALIDRGRAWRKYLNLPEKDDDTPIADDLIELLSNEHYVEHVLPYHKRIYETFSGGSTRSIHLCGDATRHFPIINKNLKVNRFDTGFPVDFAAIRKELGPSVEICGGPHIELLLNGSSEAVQQRTLEILESGVKRGGRFILREGNNLAPKTPIENIQMMYDTCKKHGRY